MPTLLDSSAWTVGAAMEPLTLTITRENLIAYAGASGDHNRIHWDESFATSVGLDGVIAHGMYTMGAAITAVENHLPAGARVLSYSTKFSAPVVVPAQGAATVVVTPTLTALNEADGTAAFTLTAVSEDTKILGLTRIAVALK